MAFGNYVLYVFMYMLPGFSRSTYFFANFCISEIRMLLLLKIKVQMFISDESLGMMIFGELRRCIKLFSMFNA